MGMPEGSRETGEMKRIAAAAVLLSLFLAGGCTQTGLTQQSVSSPVPSAEATPQMSRVAWEFAPPIDWALAEVRVGPGVVIAGGESAVFALDENDGTLRWKQPEGARAITFDSDSVSYATPSGRVVSRSLHKGTLRWARDAVCAASKVLLSRRDASDLIVGCQEGRIARIDIATGRVLASTDSFSGKTIGRIVTLGSGAYGIEGWTSGAALRSWILIIDKVSLEPLMPVQTEANILGAVGETAVIEDFCCNGRPDVYRPATIFTVDLNSGYRSTEVDLRPEPDRYPADKRPIGQGSRSLLAHGRLYLAVDQSLYYFGDPRSLLNAPKRITDNLVEPPILFADGTVGLQLSKPDAHSQIQVARFNDDLVVPVWTTTEVGSFGFRYDEDEAPNVLNVNPSNFFRISDGREIRSTCLIAAAGASIVVTSCPTKMDVYLDKSRLRYAVKLFGYRWRDGTARP
jgi:hypothetical protein